MDGLRSSDRPDVAAGVAGAIEGSRRELATRWANYTSIPFLPNEREIGKGIAAGIKFEIRMAHLGTGEVARIDGTTILVDDNAGGAGWALGDKGAPDLPALSALLEAPAITAPSEQVAGPVVVGQSPDAIGIAQAPVSTNGADVLHGTPYCEA